MLEVRNITISYGKTAVLKDVSFGLNNGEIIAVLGANGAGKTTLIRALNGTLPVSKGEILLDGKPFGSFSRRQIAQKIAVVAQENETKFPVTVREFVLSGSFARGTAFGWETRDDLRIAENALQNCDLSNYSGRLMNELSGGERQRVVLARALATEAGILMLDEPTANLDLAHQGMMFRLVRERCKNDDCSAIIITHDLNLASEFADQIVLLKDGKFFAKGTPKEILRPENLNGVFDVKVLLDENPVSGKVRVTTIY
ncbi:MAG: ABC transporter ATP-binding protein [Acidobacteriota bacterium]|nr:ABC transporter ATP-binding protein [Acidobacteriota bacterium]